MFGSKDNDKRIAEYERKLKMLKNLISNTERIRTNDPKSQGYLEGLRTALRMMQ